MGKNSPWNVFKKKFSIWNEFLNCTHFSFQEMTDKLDPQEQMTVSVGKVCEKFLQNEILLAL